MHIKHTLSVLLLSLCAAWGMAQNYNDIQLPIYTRVGAHDYLYAHKDDVEVISRKELALQALQYQMQKE